MRYARWERRPRTGARGAPGAESSSPRGTPGGRQGRSGARARKDAAGCRFSLCYQGGGWGQPAGLCRAVSPLPLPVRQGPGAGCRRPEPRTRSAGPALARGLRATANRVPATEALAERRPVSACGRPNSPFATRTIQATIGSRTRRQQSQGVFQPKSDAPPARVDLPRRGRRSWRPVCSKAVPVPGLAPPARDTSLAGSVFKASVRYCGEARSRHNPGGTSKPAKRDKPGIPPSRGRRGNVPGGGDPRGRDSRTGSRPGRPGANELGAR